MNKRYSSNTFTQHTAHVHLTAEMHMPQKVEISPALNVPSSMCVMSGKQTEGGGGMKGTQLGQGWGQSVQLPFATGDIFLKHKSNPGIKPHTP